ncbi:hypothetical protein QBC34DRAFT_440095 [Podospora aff. communis PSN243]|uniref:Uncharacterized protein n=1 Tax=Podospora aff. communis PSN243 TaxID=3040156 RepID=A0AAV9GHD7_9PEZI|nr:hypothetical protein QBC34DRAFT_440095 [Podospora aff. communis PSN243]
MTGIVVSNTNNVSPELRHQDDRRQFYSSLIKTSDYRCGLHIECERRQAEKKKIRLFEPIAAKEKAIKDEEAIDISTALALHAQRREIDRQLRELEDRTKLREVAKQEVLKLRSEWEQEAAAIDAEVAGRRSWWQRVENPEAAIPTLVALPDSPSLADLKAKPDGDAEANCETRKRKQTDDQPEPAKQKKTKPDSNNHGYPTIEFDEVYHDGVANGKPHEIMRYTGKPASLQKGTGSWYVLQCGVHGLRFASDGGTLDSPLRAATRHWGQFHGDSDCADELAISKFGKMVLNCTDSKVEMNNAMILGLINPEPGRPYVWFDRKHHTWSVVMVLPTGGSFSPFGLTGCFDDYADNAPLCYLRVSGRLFRGEHGKLHWAQNFGAGEPRVRKRKVLVHRFGNLQTLEHGKVD